MPSVTVPETGTGPQATVSLIAVVSPGAEHGQAGGQVHGDRQVARRGWALAVQPVSGEDRLGRFRRGLGL